MPIQNAFRSPAVQNLTAAATAGLMTLARPARLPRWARNVLRLTNTAGTAGAVYLASREGEDSALGIRPVSGRANAASIGSAVAIATSGLGLITSGLGIAADRKLEGFLVGKGVRRPRLWMAVGVVGVVFAVKTAQDVATKRANSTARALAARQKQATRPAPGTSAAPPTSGPHEEPPAPERA
ncbi:hypothetical protein [Leekyejoonella antrihumi]|uniref:Uncharacterized protein n=1 Tax=Leekyejoonella antrihumi TaxID=1660198 RepID=A0A563E8X0_9MICO|nr:hypothetical protein [Leekyejoonella antrihumi]TWP38947.1 hypothetical protein FGL98_00670 [Leekyejoonella antrihumi]